MAEVPATNPEIDILIELRSLHRPGSLGKLLTAIGEEGALVGDIKTCSIGKTHSVREIVVSVYNHEHLERVEKAIRERSSAEIIAIKDIVFERHEGGKIHSVRRTNVNSIAELRYIYTPGVARVCLAIKDKPELARKYTNIANSVGIFTNGTRILGLGNIGPLAGMPVMEGKAVLYDQFAGISATPILIDTEDPDEFIETVVRIAPTFGGIHLEDIKVPDCYYIEDELIRRLPQPVMHDDQHGTATVTLAAIISALRATNQQPNKDLIVAQIGLGAAGFGIAKLVIDYGLHLIGVDLNADARKMVEDYGGETAPLEEAMQKADIVVAATGRAGLLKPEMIHKGQIILALSNPEPEILPEVALAAGAAFAADGKSINNALSYPGLFKAALETNSQSISSEMKIAAAKAISILAEPDELVPSIFHSEVHQKVVEAVKKAAREKV